MAVSIKDRIFEFKKFGSMPGLERIAELLKRMGNPEENLQVIHVGGTNGKGSVSAYIYNVFLECGYRVGMYNTPYMTELNDEISVNGEHISDEALEDIGNFVIDRAEAMVMDGWESPTEFEVMTAIGLEYFKRESVDFAVLEVGLGGIGDATNIIEKPIMTVITSIGYDHRDVLGDSLSEIAREKAGIIKDGVPLVANLRKDGGDDVASANRVIARQAYEMGSVLYDVGSTRANSVKTSQDGETFDVMILDKAYGKVKISMAGEHQIENGVTALTAVEVLLRKGIIEGEKRAIYRGMAGAKQMGRFEILRDPAGATVVLDGAHNEDGAEALVKTMDDLFYGGKILTVVGVMANKEYARIAELFSHLGEDFIITEPSEDKSLEADILAREFEKMGKHCERIPQVSQAYMRTEELKAGYDVVLYVGSLYMVRAVRRLLI